MILGNPDVFEVGDPVVDQYAVDRRVGIIISIEEGEDGGRVLVVEEDGHPGNVWRIPDANAVLP